MDSVYEEGYVSEFKEFHQDLSCRKHRSIRLNDGVTIGLFTKVDSADVTLRNYAKHRNASPNDEGIRTVNLM